MTRHPRVSLLASALFLVTSAGLAAAPARAQSAQMQLVHPGYLSVGSDTSYPPMEASDINHPGQFRGADVDIAKALARAMGLKGARIVQTNFNSIIPSLQRGNFDVIMSSMNDTPERRKQIAFVDYMRLRAAEAIVVPRSSSIKAGSYHGLCGHTVSVESGTTELDGVTAAAKQCGSSKLTIMQYTADTDAFQALAAGHSEAYTTDLPVALYYVKKNPNLRFAGKAFGSGGFYGIGIAKRSRSLQAAVSKALLRIRTNGQYVRILRRYGLGSTLLPGSH